MVVVFSKQTGGASLAVNTYRGWCLGGSEAGRRVRRGVGMRWARAREGERLPYGTDAGVSARRSLCARPEPPVQGSRSLITLWLGERVNCILCLSIKKSFFLSLSLSCSLSLPPFFLCQFLFFPLHLVASFQLRLSCESNVLLAFEEMLH